VPDTSEELVELIKGSVPFAVTFAMICYIWWEHNKFFRRYGLQDAWTAFLNATLLFVVLFYVYPLKYLATALLGPVVGLATIPSLSDGRLVMLTYSVGVMAIFGVLLLLYQHAWSRRDTLGLNAADRIALRFSVRAHVISTSLAVASIVLALVLPGNAMAYPGMLYGLMGPLHTWNGFKMHRTLEKLAAPTPAPTQPNA
jgi:uncharacterized membrane protein